MSKVTDEQIEKFLQDLFGSSWMKVYKEDVSAYYAKVRKFLKSAEKHDGN